MSERCDVLIIGGGPAGSTTAWALRETGLDVLVMDRREFPRDKTCAGWITPQVVESLALDVDEYREGRVFQPITSFRVSCLGRPAELIEFPQPVSYGIRRFEFDEYLLRRCGARLRLGEPVRSLERTEEGWLVNGAITASMLVGAGGHFCPVARMLREDFGGHAPVVTATEAEFPLRETNGHPSGMDGHVPHLYFCEDLSGYGWCVRKGDFLNIGIGLVDSKETSSRLPNLLETIRREGAFTENVPVKFHGHAYHLHQGDDLPILDDRVLLVGDAAGLAYAQSGEGIRPAVESAILAAETIAAAREPYSMGQLLIYDERLESRLGRRMSDRSLMAWLPAAAQRMLARSLMRSRSFVRRVVLEDWFLHRRQPALTTHLSKAPLSNAPLSKAL